MAFERFKYKKTNDRNGKINNLKASSEPFRTHYSQCIGRGSAFSSPARASYTKVLLTVDLWMRNRNYFIRLCSKSTDLLIILLSLTLYILATTSVPNGIPVVIWHTFSIDVVLYHRTFVSLEVDLKKWRLIWWVKMDHLCAINSSRCLVFFFCCQKAMMGKF